MVNNHAFMEGYDAYWEGVDVGDNPYEKETDDFRHWQAGWVEARNHDYDESES
jgi:ribosome modulation factor